MMLQINRGFLENDTILVLNINTLFLNSNYAHCVHHRSYTTNVYLRRAKLELAECVRYVRSSRDHFPRRGGPTWNMVNKAQTSKQSFQS